MSRNTKFVYYSFHALFEFAAVFGAGDESCQIESDDALVSEHRGHLSTDYALGESLGNRRFAHARLSDQARIVFGASAKDLNHALDLFIAALDLVQLVVSCQCREIAAKCI